MQKLAITKRAGCKLQIVAFFLIAHNGRKVTINCFNNSHNNNNVYKTTFQAIKYKWATMQETPDQVRLKQFCSATESS